MPYVAEGPEMPAAASFYLGPDPAIDGLVEYHIHDLITDQQYEQALPETKRLIDDLVAREVLLKTMEAPAKGAVEG